MRKILSILLTVMLIFLFTTASFATVEYDSATKTDALYSFGGHTVLNVPAEDASSFTVDVIINSDKFTSLAGITLGFTTENIEITNMVATTSIGASMTPTVGANIDFACAGAESTAADFANVNNVLATLTLAKTGDATSATLGWSEDVISYSDDGFYTDAFETPDEYAALTINFVTADEPEEEVFEITSTGTALDANDTMKDKDGKDVVAAGDKVIAIFAKNVSDAEIAAGSYGIVFGGVRYAGQAAVPAKTAWAIKLVGSADQLPAGSYAYSIFSGDAVVEATAPWVID